MKPIEEMTQVELCAYVQTQLKEKGITATLSGGLSVSIYCSGKYVSKDIDLVNVYSVKRSHIISAMKEIGFDEVGRYFRNPKTKYILEFPPGPLTVGEEPVKQVNEIPYSTGILRVISPTDCIKDRLAAYFHWGDRQCLTQAIMVAEEQDIDIQEISRWAEGEGKRQEFDVIREKFLK
jgi:hypothetical protein